MEYDYSYNELMQMQEQAIRRVREMQQRARQTAEESGDIVDIPDAIPVVEDPYVPPAVPEPQPEQSELKVDRFEPKTAKNHSVEHNRKSNNLNSLTSLFDRIGTDSDTAMLLPLIMLLGREGTDDKLLLALLYIMT